MIEYKNPSVYDNPFKNYPFDIEKLEVLEVLTMLM